ncbi:SIS domain-containing protein [Methyloraptor flagellatus]|uniref:SIS domain-containing protein n=1 Tax=Methyloraptor flagellatus TaxID=3162530 RepID=A0AAU7XFY8_9HYPH
MLGVPCCSMGASVASIYDAPLKLRGALFVTVSQSGRSPDILALQAAAKAAGAFTVAFVNDETSPAAAEADLCLPLCAGPERSVAATKSFIASLAARRGWSRNGPRTRRCCAASRTSPVRSPRRRMRPPAPGRRRSRRWRMPDRSMSSGAARRCRSRPRRR